MRYRILLFSLIGFVLAYSAYWLVLLHHMRYTVGQFIEGYHQRGIDITYDKISYAGFPYRFEIDLKNPALLVPGAAQPLKWTSPRLLVESLAWQPGHLVVLTETSRLEVSQTHFGTVVMNIQGGKASIVNSGMGGLRRAAAEADSFSLTESADPTKMITAGHSEIHLRTEIDFPPEPATAAALKGPPLDGFAFSLSNLQITGFPQNPYGNKITLLQAQLELRGQTDPARAAKQMAAWRDRGGILELQQFALQWGALDARATGTLALDKEMRPLAAFVFKVKGWEPIPEYLREVNFIERELSDDITATLGVIVQTSTQEDEGRVAIPIAIQGGRLFFGPLPLLRVPSIAPYLTNDNAPPVANTPPAGLPMPLLWPGADHKSAPMVIKPPVKAAPVAPALGTAPPLKPVLQ